MWHMHDAGWGWWLLSGLGMVAFWALVVYAIVALVRGGAPDRSPDRPPETPDEVLKRRLAAGEITVADFERRRRALAEPWREGTSSPA